MLRPVMVTAPSMLPVPVVEAKEHLRVDVDEDDALIEGLIAGATQHLDGWTGILGRCLVEQVWRQDFDGFARELCLPLGPVLSVGSVTWRNASGQMFTVASGNYAVRTDAGGRTMLRFDRDFVFPGELHESAAVSVTYTAGYATTPEVPAVPGDGEDDPGTPAVPAISTVPASIKTAILLMVAHWYENREAVVTGTGAQALPLGAEMLIATYRRIGV